MTFAGYVFGHAFFHIHVVTLDRVLWAVLIAQLFIWWRCGWLERQPWGKPEYLLAAWFGWLAVSTLTHDWRTDGSEPLAHLLFFFTIPVGLYFVARHASLSERKVELLLAACVVFGIYLAVTSFAETRQWWWMVYPSHIGSTDNMNYFGRGRGPLLNATGNGVLLTTCLCGGLALWPRTGRSGKLMLLVYAAIMAVGIYCTYTRSVWLGAAAAVAMMLWFALPRRTRIPLFVCGAVAMAVLLGGFGERFVAFKRDVYATASDTRESIRLRPILAMVAWKMFLDQPLAGCGFGQYTHARNAYLGDRDTQLTLEHARPYTQHNVLLRLVTETGLPGVAMFVVLIVLWATDALRIARNRDGPWWARALSLVFLGTLIAYMTNGMFHDVSEINMMNAHLLLWAGLLTRPADPGSAPAGPATAPPANVPQAAARHRLRACRNRCATARRSSLSIWFQPLHAEEPTILCRAQVEQCGGGAEWRGQRTATGKRDPALLALVACGRRRDRCRR